jgi:TRAP-type mannitol/chloroaromatic compound transport system permease small subunit
MFNFFSKLTKWMDNITIFIMKIFRWNSPILMYLIVQEVILRYVFNAPTIWGLDTMTYLSAAGRVIGFGYGCMVHSHVTMDIFTVNLNFKKAKMLETFNYIVYYLPLLIALIVVTLTRGLRALRLNEKLYSVWRPPLAPIVLFIVGAYVLMVMQVLIEIIKNIISLQKGSDAWLKQR